VGVGSIGLNLIMGVGSIGSPNLLVGVGSIGSSNLIKVVVGFVGSLGTPKFIHFLPGVPQHMNVLPDHLLIIMILADR